MLGVVITPLGTWAFEPLLKNPSSLLGIALHCAAVGQSLVALGMRQGDLGFLSAQVFALTRIGLSCVRFHDRYYAVSDLGNDLLRSGHFSQHVGLEHLSGVPAGDASNDAFAEDDAVVFEDLVMELPNGASAAKSVTARWSGRDHETVLLVVLGWVDLALERNS